MTDSERELLTQAEALLTDLWKRLLAVKPWLDKPYPDAPDTTPWARTVESRARRAHDLSLKIRRHLRDGT
jgi:hypothetical protein